MEKLEWKRTCKDLYLPSPKDFGQVTVPAMSFLMIDGQGDPNTEPAYAKAVEWLFSVSYAVKFASKKETGRDYAVFPLEGLWWADDMASFIDGGRDKWKWTMMIAQPDWITQATVDAAIGKASAKLGKPPATLRLQAFEEGLSVQIMYIGAYRDEGPVIRRLHQEYLPANGLTENGHHHEIYIGDPRRVAPEKLKTVIRQPVRKAG